jgi:hypothetical protein
LSLVGFVASLPTARGLRSGKNFTAPVAGGSPRKSGSPLLSLVAFVASLPPPEGFALARIPVLLLQVARRSSWARRLCRWWDLSLRSQPPEGFAPARISLLLLQGLAAKVGLAAYAAGRIYRFAPNRSKVSLQQEFLCSCCGRLAGWNTGSGADQPR